MPEVSQINLSYKELIELIIKHSDIHEGKWSLSLGFQIGVGLYGPAPDQMSLGAMIGVNQIGIQRVQEGAPQPPGAIWVDAKEVNPPPKVVTKKAK